jgi:heme-degrading monooxygenase HmoA
MITTELKLKLRRVGMFIAVNKITIPNAERGQAMEQAFQHAMPGLKQFKGFLGMELWHQEDGNMLAVSRWESKAAMEVYTSSDLFGHHHGGASDGQAGGHADHSAHEAAHNHADHGGHAGAPAQGTMYYDATILD